MWKVRLILVAIFMMAARLAFAADLVVGVKSEVQLDPHYAWTDANDAYYDHIYGGLTRKDPNLGAHPWLAESWTAVTHTQWRFTLRQGVTFHDGTPVTAADVVASFERVKTIKAASPYTGAIPGVESVVAEDDHTVIFNTSNPVPLLPINVASIQILPAAIAKSATTESFSAGPSAIGTGPYKVKSYQAGQQLVLVRNEDFWGDKPYWDTITFRFIPNDAARVAALLGGDVDMIDYVPPQMVERIKANPDLRVRSVASIRVMALTIDSGRQVSPQVFDLDGKPLALNPMTNLKVRQAMTLAIDRKALTEKVMGGLAEPAGQLAPIWMKGHSDDVKVPEVDVEKAKTLLAEAGYPNGFAATINCTNDRYANDAQVCQALGQMLARIGLKMNVQTMPGSVYFGQANPGQPGGPKFSMMLTGWTDPSGEPVVLEAAIHTYDKPRGLGNYNRASYSNPELDKLIEAAMSEWDNDARHALQAQAMKVAMDDVAAIPLYYQSVVVATRKSIGYKPWPSEVTIAREAFVTEDGQ